MYFNTFARGLEPTDMSQLEEFSSLLESASDLGIAYKPPVKYRARNIVANGQRFHCLEWGDESAPLLFEFHGANQTGHSWDLVSLNLASDFHVFAIDQRGHGDSEWPRDGDMTLGAMALDAGSLIDQVMALFPSSRKPVIMAHSMGALNLMTLTIQRPDLPEKLVLLDMGPETNSEGSETIQGFIRTSREWDSVEHYIERVSAYDRFRPREHIMRTMKYNIMERADGKLVSKHFPRLLRGDNTTSEAERARAMGTRPTLDDVKRIMAPVLITRGAESNVLMPDQALRFAQALPNGRTVDIPNCGHNVQSGNTSGFLAEVRPFLGV